MEVTPGQQMPNLEMDLGEAVLDLLYMELEASELDTQDPAVAKAIHGALDYAKSHFRY